MQWQAKCIGIVWILPNPFELDTYKKCMKHLPADYFQWVTKKFQLIPTNVSMHNGA